MKKLFSILLVISVTGAGLYAQNTFFPSKKGMVLTYADKNAKGKINGYSQLTIKDVKGSGANMTILYAGESLDKNRKPSNPPLETSYQVVVKNGVVILDMKQMFSSVQLKDMDAKMKITGTPMELPGSLKPGQTLKDADATMTIDMGIMKMETVIKLTEGKCLAIEDVTVPAGTYKCHKITQTATTTFMKKTIVTKTFSWYAPGVGTIKTETYDAKDKLMGSMELIEQK